ncbi:ATP-binding protein [Alkalihalobacterium elongatum]|uniref:ATP-binding protein n=1 Tax=Alkalihalobacterium elongatum TaxID=2675466 RepID=UPI001C1FBC67|nr:ATP-binding protein [Alkalihalobacterium elongatum]
MNKESLQTKKDLEKSQQSEIDRLNEEIDHLKIELNAYKQMTKTINDSEKEFERLFHNISDAVYYTKVYRDGMPGNFIKVNNIAYSRLGYTHEEMLKMSPLDIDFHEKEELLQIIQNIYLNETLTFETVHVCKNGQHIPVEIKTHTLDVEGEKYVLSVCRDISVRKKAEQMLVQAEKMNVVGQLAAGIAHEIRNPLTSLKGFVQLFRSGTIPNETFLHVMEDELERIDLISSEFLSLAKPANSDFCDVNLNDILKDVVALLDTEAFKQSITIITKMGNEVTIVPGVNNQLKQVFINLIKNAIEVMPNGGTITLKLETKNDTVFVSIQDEGCGMTVEQLNRLGEPFFTTKETGTGIGLMVTYTIIENHNGKVDVKSILHEGTTFTVQLPKTVAIPKD